MRFVTTRGRSPATSLEWALFDGLAPDGSLYVPESIDTLTPAELADLPSRSLVELGMRVLRPYTAEEVDEATLAAIVGESLNFAIPLKEIEPGVHVLELFHGPTLAFKDIGARVMARLISRCTIARRRRRSWWRRRATPEAPSDTPSTACPTRASSCSTRTAA
jgi:threonine synthase